MLLPLQGRRIAYDLVGPDSAPTVCITHSLASDGGSWAEQVPPLLQAGFRVLRIDMRSHGGSDPVPGDHYSMKDLAGDVAMVLDALSLPRVHYIGLSIGGMIGQAFALRYAARVKSLMLCDTLPAASASSPKRGAPKRIAAASAAAPNASTTASAGPFPIAASTGSHHRLSRAGRCSKGST